MPDEILGNTKKPEQIQVNDAIIYFHLISYTISRVALIDKDGGVYVRDFFNYDKVTSYKKVGRYVGFWIFWIFIKD